MRMAFICLNKLPAFRTSKIHNPLLTGIVIPIPIFPAADRTTLNRIFLFIIMRTFLQIGTRAAPLVDRINAGTVMRPANFTALYLQVLNPCMSFSVSAVVVGRFTVVYLRLFTTADLDTANFGRSCRCRDRLGRLLRFRSGSGAGGLLFRIAFYIKDSGTAGRGGLFSRGLRGGVVWNIDPPLPARSHAPRPDRR